MMDKKSEDSIVIQSLQTLACFAIAKQLWSRAEIKKKFDVCLKAAEYEKDYSSISEELTELLNEVQELAKNLHPIVPDFFGRNISEVVNSIGKDLFNWIIANEKHNIGIMQQTATWNIHLTPSHSTDRIKSGCISQNFDFTSETLCKCCYKRYVRDPWEKLTPKLRNDFEIIFDKYKFHAIAFWKCYIDAVGYPILQETLIVNNHPLFENYDPLENIFKISIYCGYDAAIIYYWGQLTIEQKIRTTNILLGRNQLSVSISEAWVDHWTNELIASKVQITTLIFLWNQLDAFCRTKLTLFSYLSVFIIIIRWKISEIYFNQICNNWKPIFTAPREVTSSITEDDKHAKIFYKLRKPVDNMYSSNNKTVAEFLWKYRTIYEDIDSTAVVVNKFEKTTKIEIMASPSQIISVYNVNEKFHRCQEFITSEILNFPQPEEMQIDMPEMEEVDNEESTLKKLSMLVIFVIAMIYVTIFILLIW